MNGPHEAAQEGPSSARPRSARRSELTESVTAFGTISTVPSTRAPSSIVVIRRCARGGGAHAGLIWAVSQPVPEVVARWAKQRIVPSPSRSILGVVPGKQGKWRVRTQWLAIAIRDLGQARAAPVLRQPRDKEHQRAANDSHKCAGDQAVGIGPIFENCANSTTRRYPRDHRRGPDRQRPSTTQAPPPGEECKD